MNLKTKIGKKKKTKEIEEYNSITYISTKLNIIFSNTYKDKDSITMKKSKEIVYRS